MYIENTTRQGVRKLPWLVGVGGDLCFYEFSIVKIILSNKTNLNLKKKKNFTVNSFSQFKLYLRENTYITISLSFRFLFNKIPTVKKSTYSLKPKINVE